MGRISDYIFIETAEHPVLYLEKTVKEDELVAFFQESVPKLDEFIADKKHLPADVPYMKVVDDTPGALKVVVGIAISFHVKGNDEIRNDVIPAGKKMLCYYQGDNNDMTDLIKDMEDNLKKKGYTRTSPYYEFYLNSIKFGFEKLLTEIMCTIE